MRQRRKLRPKPVPIPDANINQYFSYREAWGRIRRAKGHGYYLEAVTLEESIIADRLISFLVSAGKLDAGLRPTNMVSVTWCGGGRNSFPSQYQRSIFLICKRRSISGGSVGIGFYMGW